MDLSGIFTGDQGLLIAGLLAFVVVSLVFGAKQLKIAEHKWAGDQANTLAAMGFSPTVVAPWTNLAAGDVAGAIGAGISAARYLESRDNRLHEGLAVLKTLAASHPNEVKAFFNDYLGGADDSKLMSDAQSAFQGAPQLTAGPILQHLHQAAEAIQQLGEHGDLSSIATIIASNPVLAPLAGTLTKLAATAHAAGAATTSAPAGTPATVPAVAAA